jgi:hypothetical protein
MIMIISYSDLKYSYVHNPVCIQLLIPVYLSRVNGYSDRCRATLHIQNFELHGNDWSETSSKKKSLRTPWAMTLGGLQGHLNVKVKSKLLLPLEIAPKSALLLAPHFKIKLYCPAISMN